ncbi:MAG: hypothetical protein LBH50_06620 [Spirochaetaceae bacterium]|jgi:hypothetical protein|nr:hypothetical protein [Spirochaetaceae bacterium]
MAKRIYEPGELDKVKKRLGNISEKEAKYMQRVLGGEIGYERSETSVSDGAGRGAPTGAVSRPKRLVETVAGGGAVSDGRLAGPPKFQRPGKLSYIERVKMDACAGSPEFVIKTPFQVLVSRLCFFAQPADRVSPWFVKIALNEYYAQLERLITSARLLFPRSDAELGRKLQDESPAAFKILNVIRNWRLNVIMSEIGKVQSRPRNAFVRDFETMLREIYKPLYILEKLDANSDVREAFQILYGIRLRDQPTEKAERLYGKITEAALAFKYAFFKLHRLLYPLLMKTIATRYQDYESFFIENGENYRSFLGVSEADQLPPGVSKVKPANKTDDSSEDTDDSSGVQDEAPEERQEKQDFDASETKAFERGLKLLETLFPKAPWDELKSYPDFYPYFADALDIKKNGELLAPEDPAHLAMMLSQIIEELLYGFRHIEFCETANSSSLAGIVDDWHTAVSESFEKKYLPLIYEYSHYFEHSSQRLHSTYAMNIAADIHWTRRYYFLPNYEYTPVTPPTFAKKDVVALYKTARRLRGDLAVCAAAIERANKEGGAAADAPADGIKNPWEPYNFQVENPLSKRLDMLLGKKQRNNASLVFFTLATATVLDYYLCGRNSPAYATDCNILFRHTKEDEMKPVFWVEKRADTFALFKKSVEELKEKK